MDTSWLKIHVSKAFGFRNSAFPLVKKTGKIMVFEFLLFACWSKSGEHVCFATVASGTKNFATPEPLQSHEPFLIVKIRQNLDFRNLMLGLSVGKQEKPDFSNRTSRAGQNLSNVRLSQPISPC